MPNLIADLGPDYITQMYSGAFFMHSDAPHMLERVRNGAVACQKVEGNRWVPTNLEYDDFPDMAKFSWPALGYRNVAYKKHNVVVEVGMLRAAKRGFRTNLLTADVTKAGAMFLGHLPPVTLLGQAHESVKTVMQPTYYTLQHAQKMLHDGQAVSCAISNSLAIEINPFAEDPKELSVLYQGAKVGAMLSDGTFVIPSRIATRLVR